MEDAPLPEICPAHLRRDVTRPIIDDPVGPAPSGGAAPQTLTATGSPAKSASRPNTPQKQSQKGSSSSLYCEACKKKFSNEATYKAHESSAKHIKESKRLAGAGGGGRKTSGAPQQMQDGGTSAQASDQLAEALWSQQQALALEKQPRGDPVRTVQLYWKAAVGLARHHHTAAAAECLERTLALIQQHDLAGKASGSRDVHLRVQHEAHILLARTLRPFRRAQSLHHYRQHLHRFFTAKALAAMETEYDDRAALLKRCAAACEPFREGDPAAMVSSLVQEILSLESRGGASVRSVVLCALLCTLQPGPGSCRLLARMYEDVGLPWLAADCYADADDLRTALALALDSDDQVRARRLLARITASEMVGAHDDAVSEASARLTTDWERLDAQALLRSGGIRSS